MGNSDGGIAPLLLGGIDATGKVRTQYYPYPATVNILYKCLYLHCDTDHHQNLLSWC